MTFKGTFPETRRIVLVGYFDVVNGNLNADPGTNMPRQDEYTLHGEVSDVSIKRDIRDSFARDREALYIEKHEPLSKKKQEIIDEIAPGLRLDDAVDADDGAEGAEGAEAGAVTGKRGKKGTAKPTLTAEQVREAVALACRKFRDLRWFGGVLGANKSVTLDNVRGCVGINFAGSVDPIQVRDHQISRMTTENDKVALGESAKNQTFGQKAITPYALYRMTATVDMREAEANGFTDEDYALLVDRLLTLYQYKTSAARGVQCGMQALFAFHCTARGVAALSTTQIMTYVRAVRDIDIEHPRAFADYRIEVAHESLPDGVHYEVLKRPIYGTDLNFLAA